MLETNNFTDSASLAQGLAKSVAQDLLAGIKNRGTASLAVSGGNTPKAFFEMLAQNSYIAWDKTTITLVDERWVDESSERSNARLVAKHLMQGPAANAHFVPLYAGGETSDAAQISKTNALILESVPMPFDAVILGMGNDGHTASFFPQGDHLHAALNEAGPAIAISAPGAGEPRVTLTLPTLLNTNSLYLHIEGPQKQATLAKALAGENVEEMPVRAVLFQQEKPVRLYWCP